MPLRNPVCSIAFASFAALGCIAAPTVTSAQGLIDFLWGGTQEWGGGRQVVSFDPKYTPGQIIVSFGDRRLYHITAKGRATSYPIAIPREQSRWQGTTTVSAKRENPSWRPTAEMLKENPKLPSWVPGGHPMNPLGVRAMYLGSSTYRIHGTDAPWTIGQDVSKGCIRMYNEDVLDLYPRVPVGTRVTVTWQRFNTQYVASGADSASEPTSFALSSGYKQPATRRQIRNLPPPLAAADDVGDAQTEAVRAAFTRPAPATAVLDEEPAASEKKAAKHDKPAKDKKQAKSNTSEPTAPQATSSKLPAVATAETAVTKHKPARADEAATGATDAADAARRAAAAAAKAAEAARQAAEAARKAAEDAKRATSSVTGSKESTAPTDTRASL